MKKIEQPTRRFGQAAAAFAIAAMISACGTVPMNPELTRTRSELSSTRSDPVIARNAALELDQADQALQRAEAAWADKRNEEETHRLAYLAQQRITVARNVGTMRENESRLKGVGEERERLRAETATAAAASAQQQAEAARQQAAAAQQQASVAQQQASAAQQQATAESERAKSLQQDLETMQAKQTQRGMVVTLGDVLFATGRSTLQPGALRTADRLASILQQYPERRLLIEGFTDNVGKSDMNLDLSRRRAEAFRQALVDRGISADRIEVKGYGEQYPIADNNTAAGRTQNRRVEILFSDAQGHFPPR